MDKIRDLLNSEDHSSSFTKEEKEQGKLVCIIGYFWILFFVPLLVKNNKYCRYHANQSLCLLLFSLIIGMVLSLLSIIFSALSLGIFVTILKILFYISLLVYLVLGIYNVINDKAKDLPLIGNIRIIK